MIGHAPSGQTANHRRAVAALLPLLVALMLIDSAASATDLNAAGTVHDGADDTSRRLCSVTTNDEYPIVIGSDEDTLIVCPATSVACDGTDDSGQLDTDELARQLYDHVFNAGDPDVAAALIDDDAVIQTAFGTYRGRGGLLDYVAFVKRTYPDADFEVTDVANRGHSLEIGWVMTATRIVVDPVEHPLTARVEIIGSSTISLGQERITSLSITNGTVLIREPFTETT